MNDLEGQKFEIIWPKTEPILDVPATRRMFDHLRAIQPEPMSELEMIARDIYAELALKRDPAESPWPEWDKMDRNMPQNAERRAACFNAARLRMKVDRDGNLKLGKPKLMMYAVDYADAHSLLERLTAYSKQGYRLHTALNGDQLGTYTLIFKRKGGK